MANPSVLRLTLAVATGAALGVGSQVFANTAKTDVRVAADIHVLDRFCIDVQHANSDAGQGGAVTRQVATGATFDAYATVGSMVIDEVPEKVSATGTITGQCKTDMLAAATSCILPAIKTSAKLP